MKIGRGLGSSGGITVAQLYCELCDARGPSHTLRERDLSRFEAVELPHVVCLVCRQSSSSGEQVSDTLRPKG